jgi:PAS domain S-box-containing protein
MLSDLWQRRSIGCCDHGAAIGVIVAARPIHTSTGQPASALSDPRLVRRLNRFISFASVAAITVGLLGLIGWKLGIPVLKSVIPGEAVIRPNTAVGLMLTGLSLWLLQQPDDRPIPNARKLGGQLLAVVVAAAGLLNVIEYMFGWNSGLDQLLFYETSADAIAGLRPGLMAPITAFDFILLGLALIGLDWTVMWRAHRLSPTQVLAATAVITSIVGLLDFVLASATSYTHIALQTAVVLCLLSLCIACARTDRAIGGLVVSVGVGGTLVRRLLPGAIIIPILIGGLWWKAVSEGHASMWAGGTMMVVTMITLLGSLTVLIGFLVNRTDVERRKSEQALHRSEEELEEAQRLARMGSWWWDPNTDNVTWSEELYRIVGFDPKQPLLGYRTQSRFYTQESFARLDAAVQRTMQTGTPYELDLELTTADGTRRLVTGRGEVERDATGRVALVRGTVQDMTEQKQAQLELQRSADEIRDLYDHAPCGYHSLDKDGLIVRINNTELQWLRYAPGEVIGKLQFSDIVAPKSREIFAAEFRILKVEGRVRDIELDLIRKDGSLLPVLLSATAVIDAGGNYLMSRSMVYDMTERRRADDRLRRVNRAHRAISTCNQALVRATDESTLVQQICRIVVEEAGYRLCWVGYAADDAAKTVRPIAQAGFEAGYLKSLNVTWGDSERGRGPTGTCIRTGHIQMVKDMATDPRLAPWRAAALQRGYASSIAFPLGDAAKPFGALTIYSAEIEAFGEEEVALLTELAGDLSYGIMSLRTQDERNKAEAEKITREQEAAIGFKIQQMLLLDEPPQGVPGLRIAALTIPSQRIDGDFYGFFTHQDESLDIIVADVMGKGIPAALLGAATKSRFTGALCHLIAMAPARALPEPREVVTLAHSGMVRQLIELESFVTLCYARINLSRRQLDVVDCGHTGVIHLRGGTGLCEMIHGDNLPLGIREGEIYQQIAIPFEPGDTFLFFSDGITEASDATCELFGADRLMACVRSNRSRAPDALVGAVRTAVVAFAGSDRLADDFTCVAVQVGQQQIPLAKGEIELRSELGELGRARDFVRNFCCTLPGSPLDENQVGELELAVNEAVSNIMKHAYHGRTDQRISLEAEAFMDHVAVRLHHLGDSFDPSGVRPPSFDGSRESGFGIYLLSNCVDEVRYFHDERGGNCITLVKKHKSCGEGRHQ